MRSASIFTMLQMLGAAAVISLLSACSGGSSFPIAPKQITPQAGADSLTGRAPDLSGPRRPLIFGPHPVQRTAGYYSCPATGPIKYVSDSYDSIINVYVGRFAGQAPCGQITAGLNFPECLHVESRTHDLYVANMNDGNILVFHRGQQTPYNSYVDPTLQVPFDATIAQDATLMASNYSQGGGTEAGSISTWTRGANGGTFVGNFPMTNDAYGQFITVDKNDTVYYNDLDNFTNLGALWKLKCPAGRCGAQTQIAGVSFYFPGGMAFDEAGDLVAIDAHINRPNNAVDVFELPNPSPSTFPLLTGWSTQMAINRFDHHVLIADQDHGVANEYLYPSGKLAGTVTINPGGRAIGVAVDP